MSLADVQLHKVETTEEAAEFMRFMGERRPVLAVDTETTGLEWWTPHFTRLVQFGDAHQGWTLSVENWKGLIREALSRYDGLIVMHNAKYDLHALEAVGLPTPQRHQLHDILIMHSLLEPLKAHHLKGLSDRFIDPTASSAQKLLDKAKLLGGWDWATIPEDVPAYGIYGALDTVLTARLWERFAPQVAQRFAVAYEREMAAQWILYRAERRGIRIDTPYTQRLSEEWTIELAQLKLELEGHGVMNPNVNRQIEESLRAYGWTPDEYTDTGRAKLDKKVFESILSSQVGVSSDVIRLLVDYKQKLKWKSTYLDTFLHQQDKFGVVHPDIRTMKARTGRMSITNPAMQTLPKDPRIRNCVLPHADGEVIYAIDYDSQELRIFAHFAEEAGLIEAVRSGRDMHQYTASEIYGVPYDEVGKDDPRRQLAKNVRYAQIFGGGEEKIAATAGVGVDMVRHFNQVSDQLFPGIRSFMKEVEYRGKLAIGKDGRAFVTTWGGREVEAEPDAVYKLVNYLIQGTAADVLKEKLIQLDSAGLAEYIIVPVHDELLFSVPAEDGSEIASKCREIMEEREAFAVPLTCGLDGPFERWGEKYAA